MEETGTLLTLFSEHDLRPTRQAVRRFAQSLPFDAKQVADITLAVAEACINGVRHGEASGDEPVVTVTAARGADHLAIDVVDRGIGFTATAPVMPEPLAESGRGLALMFALMDRVAIRSSRRGTHVHMVKYFNE